MKASTTTEYNIDFACGEYWTYYATTNSCDYAKEIAKALAKTEKRVRVSRVTKTWAPVCEFTLQSNNERGDDEQC